MIICPHCGIRNRINSNFCNNCGADLREVEAPAPAAPDATGHANEPAIASAPATPIDSRPEGTIAAHDDSTVSREGPAELEKSGEEHDDEPAADEPSDADAAPPDDSLDRLLGGLPGLLQPHAVSSIAPGDTESASSMSGTAARAAPAGLATTLAEIDVSRLRRLLSEEPIIAKAPLNLAGQERHALHIPWLFCLLGLLMLAPFVVSLSALPAAPRSLPGVAAAYGQIEQLPDSQPILVWWAYDPATAGEMDLVTLPLLRHLVARQSRLFLFTPLPTGVATAERLLARLDSEINLARSAADLRSADYLPGGPAVLPLVGQNLAGAARDGTSRGRANANPAAGAPVAPPKPALALVVAAQAEDVQHWLEQVQPRNGVPVVAATGAAADPVLRPYVDSGQLAGLVSGVDGGLAYEALLAGTDSTPLPRLTQAAIATRFQMVQVQNWGNIGFMLIILLGNLAILVNRG